MFGRKKIRKFMFIFAKFFVNTFSRNSFKIFVQNRFFFAKMFNKQQLILLTFLIIYTEFLNFWILSPSLAVAECIVCMRYNKEPVFKAVGLAFSCQTSPISIPFISIPWERPGYNYIPWERPGFNFYSLRETRI